MREAKGQLPSVKSVRTRFAPSPTGYLHIGGIRTALFAWLVARHAGGQFVLRLEDTDKNREIEGSEVHLITSLKTLGIMYDEGPDIGGPFAPYRQSERLESYERWARKLIENGRAYADPYSPEKLDELRAQAKTAKKPFLFRNFQPKNPPEWKKGMPLRFKSDPKAYQWHDEVMGDLHSGPEVIDDFILIKSDGYPTYNFAHIVDDAEMEMTHVIRGQEFLASMPNYINLYEALGLERPVFATMPHILGPDGKKKLSKRDGAKDVLDYVREGFLPEALVSFIATLGWNDGTEQEIYSIEELLKKFSLGRVGRSGAKFDEQRLIWMNGYYIRQLPADKLWQLSNRFWPAEADDADPNYKKAVLGLVQERLKYFGELPQLTDFFFSEPGLTNVAELFKNPPDKQLKKSGEPGLYKKLLKATIEILEVSDFTYEGIKNRLSSLLDQEETKPAVLFPVIRIAVSGKEATPELAGTLHVLGKERVLKRLGSALGPLEK